MLRLITRRLALSLPLLLIVPTLTFLLAALIPGDVARTVVGANGTEEQYLELRGSLSLDDPLHVRYWDWLVSAVRGDLGASLLSRQPVTSLLNDRLGVTLALAVGSTLVAALIGVALGIVAALRSRSLGRLVDVISLAGLAVPNFFLGLILVTWFAVAIPLFPATGHVPFAESPADWFRGLVLPVVTLAVPGVAVVAKQTRDAMLDVLDRPFVRTLRATGLPRRSVVLRHALRSAGVPVVTVAGVVFVGALSGTVLVETVFAMPGLGGMAVQATGQHDLPLIQGVAVYFTVLVIAANLVVDLAYGWLDPRMRVS
ncbi:ABC transporter permease [Actinomadura viridis]|uniref:Peptide/nickel transport system permease protein n=1 Tax=Actinomadura viridis TaxID=58110 RepID=A0A931GQR3_9ACTN|nr:ABC transporter permease [Actinomadura viridis]MBG6088834.1 peptide/nickel transport system permease protein [Actinomadura viridis]